jgi:hypothetical protein
VQSQGLKSGGVGELGCCSDFELRESFDLITGIGNYDRGCVLPLGAAVTDPIDCGVERGMISESLEGGCLAWRSSSMRWMSDAAIPAIHNGCMRGMPGVCSVKVGRTAYNREYTQRSCWLRDDLRAFD